MDKRIDLFRPAMGPAEEAAALRVLRSGWLGQGPEVEALEREFAAFTGAPYAVAVSSCTAALELLLRAHGIGPGDEVIVPTLTFTSTAQAVVEVGARPVFADVRADTLCMDDREIGRLTTTRTKMMIPVHYGGRYARIDSGERRIWDCAHAAGTRRGGHSIGFGESSAWSFQAVKNICAGDGGMVTTNEGEIADRIRSLRWLGIDKSTAQRTSEHGYSWGYDIATTYGVGKFNLCDLAAAIARAQLARLPELNGRRKAIADRYMAELADLSGDQSDFAAGIIPPLVLPVPDTPGVSESSWHLFACWAQERDNLMKWLGARGISTGVHYRPLHTYSAYGRNEPLPVAEAAWHHLISLPMHPGLTEDDVGRVIDGIKDFYKRKDTA